MNRETVRKIVRKVNFPYKIQPQQQLLPRDPETRLAYALWARAKLEEDREFFRFVCFGDECSVSNEGITNRQNTRHWAPQNPNWTIDVPHQYQWKINLWGGIVGDRVIGPYFIEGNLNSEKYLTLLEDHLDDMLHNVPEIVREQMWWMQDGAGAHTALTVRAALNRRFPERWIGLHGPVNWPARSPDLTPLDFFLWGALHDKVFVDAPTTEDDMRRRIVAAFPQITARSLQQMRRSNMRRRIDLCIEQNGGHIEHLIKRHRRVEGERV